MLTIYRRFKNPAGEWEIKAVKEGRGIKHSAIVGPFSVRPYSNSLCHVLMDWSA